MDWIIDQRKPSLKSESDLDKARAMLQLTSPDTDEFKYFVIEGNPKSKMRPRFGKGRAYKSKEQANNEEYIAMHFRKHFKKPYEKNISIGCIFYRSNKQRIDVDNMLKNVMDSGNNIAWLDDSQVTAKVGVVELDKENPRTVIIIGHHESTMVRNLSTTNKCQKCKKEYELTSAYWKGKSKFCSRECASLSRGENLKILKDCAECNKPFKRNNYKSIYCSNECRYKGSARKRNKLGKGYCKDCNKELSKPGYVQCRDCWRNKGKTNK